MSTIEEMAAELPDYALQGRKLVVDQILRELALAATAATGLHSAMRQGDDAAFQQAAEQAARAAQTGHVLAWKLAKDVAARRGRRCKVLP